MADKKNRKITVAALIQNQALQDVKRKKTARLIVEAAHLPIIGRVDDDSSDSDAECDNHSESSDLRSKLHVNGHVYACQDGTGEGIYPARVIAIERDRVQLLWDNGKFDWISIDPALVKLQQDNISTGQEGLLIMIFFLIHIFSV